MVMPHPLLPVGLPPAGIAMAMNQMSQLSGLANMAAMSHVQEEESKVRCLQKRLMLMLTINDCILILNDQTVNLIDWPRHPSPDVDCITLLNTEDLLCLVVAARDSFPESLPQ